MKLTTPNDISNSVKQLCKKLPDEQAPVFLDLEPEFDAIVADCFFNVERKIARDGGSVQYGWCIWSEESILIEGEFHAVWKSPKGELVDITPKIDGELKILFVPDNKTSYAKEPIDNVRVPLSEDPQILEMIAMNERMSELKTKFNDGTGQSQIPIDEVAKHVFGMPSNTGETKIGRNAACPCQSGKKYKKCCGK